MEEKKRIFEEQELEQAIEALLFFKNEPVRIKELSKLLNKKEDAIKKALDSLEASLKNRGVRLIKKDDKVVLGTAPELSALIESLIKDTLHKELGKAGLETLSIVLYLGPVTRSRIDYIRGVNSTFILRNLMIRGLVEKIQNPKDQRSFLYRPTMDLLAHLGISHIEELPEYDKVRHEIEMFEQSNQE